MKDDDLVEVAVCHDSGNSGDGVQILKRATEGAQKQKFAGEHLGALTWRNAPDGQFARRAQQNKLKSIPMTSTPTTRLARAYWKGPKVRDGRRDCLQQNDRDPIARTSLPTPAWAQCIPVAQKYSRSLRPALEKAASLTRTIQKPAGKPGRAIEPREDDTALGQIRSRVELRPRRWCGINIAYQLT